jgi:hypothetical protein
MYYTVIATGEVLSIDAVRLRHPQTSIPDGANLTSLGYAAAAAPVVVPPEVTRAQALIALSRIGITEAAIDTVLAAMPEGQAKVEASIWWRQSNAFKRSHPTLAMLAPALGLTAAQIDELFVTASTL